MLACVAFALSQCCQAPRSIEHDTAFVGSLIGKTVALEHFVVQNDDDTYSEVEPDMSGAELHVYCAGTWISPTEILTAFHCIRDRKGPHTPPPSPVPDDIMMLILGLQSQVENDPTDAVVYYSQRNDIDEQAPEKHVFWTAKVERFDKLHDLALLYVPKGEEHPSHASASLAKSVSEGARLHIIGHPARVLWAYMQGYVSAWRMVEAPNGDDGKVQMMQVEAPIYYGNSGGPAFDDAGHLVGVCSERSTRVPNLGLFVPLDRIRTFLAQ